MRDGDRRRPGLAEVLRVHEHDRVRRRRLRAVAAAARPGLPVVRVPGQVDRPTRVDRDRRPMGKHRGSPYPLVRRELRAPVRHRADAEAEAPIAVLEDRRLDDGRLQLVVVELAVAVTGAPVRKRPVVVDPGGAAGIATVVGDEHWCPLPLPSTVSVAMKTWFALPPASHGRSPSWQSAFPLSQVLPPSTDEKIASLTRSMPVL